MSVTFYGLTADNQPIMLDFEDLAYLNMNNGNAHAFLAFLGLPGCDESSGDASVPDTRRAIIRARATFEKKVGNFTREGSDTKRPGRPRVLQGGIGEDYFAMRLDSFEKFLNVVVEKGATSIYWG